MKFGVGSSSVVCLLFLSAVTQASVLIDNPSTGQALIRRVMPVDLGGPIVSSNFTQEFSGGEINHIRAIPFASFAPVVGAGVDFDNVAAVTMFVDGSTVVSPPGMQPARRSTD